ncbi:MAG: hypothetical protein C0483_04665 [Pirellula sp.]|nr:hypothetical protein [Pirellula sp.]
MKKKESAASKIYKQLMKKWEVPVKRGIPTLVACTLLAVNEDGYGSWSEAGDLETSCAELLDDVRMAWRIIAREFPGVSVTIKYSEGKSRATRYCGLTDDLEVLSFDFVKDDHNVDRATADEICARLVCALGNRGIEQIDRLKQRLIQAECESKLQSAFWQDFDRRVAPIDKEGYGVLSSFNWAGEESRNIQLLIEQLTAKHEALNAADSERLQLEEEKAN